MSLGRPFLRFGLQSEHLAPELGRLQLLSHLTAGEPNRCRTRQHRSLDLSPAFLIFKSGLIDEVLAPASTNKRPVPQWQCHVAKAKSSASSPIDMHVNERTVGRSGGLFVWVAWVRPSR